MLAELYDQCFESASKEFVRVQCRDEECECDNSYFFNAKQKPQHTSRSTPMYADRQSNILIYNTINKLIQQSKESPTKDIKIKWEDFEKFTPMQIVGVMLLKKESIKSVAHTLFPNAFSSNVG